MTTITHFQRRVLLFGFTFLAYLIVNVDHITDPPYWDAITGLFTQGLWLRNHGFNYALLLKQPGFYQGGPNGNPCYIGPTLVGVLLNYLSPTVTFFLLHVATYLCTSIVFLIFFELISSFCSTQLAILWTLSAAANPIWTGQSASLYLEIPLELCISLSLYYFWKGRYGVATWICVLGFFIKSSVLLFGLVYFLWGSFLAIRTFVLKQDRFPPLGWSLFLPLPIFLILSRGGQIGESYTFSNFALHMTAFLIHIKYLFPILAALTLTMLIALPFGIISPGQFKMTFADGRLALLFILFILGFWASYFIYSMPIPRYTLMILFPTIYLLAYCLKRAQTLSLVLASVLTGISLMNQQGQWYPRLPFQDGRSGNCLERSREYLKDIDSDRSICSLLETTMSQYSILVKWPLTQMLTHPELGYVHKPLPHVVEASIDSPLNPTTYWIPWLKSAHYRKSICVYVPHVYEYMIGLSLRPARDDVILYEDKKLPGTIAIYYRLWKGQTPPTMDP
jgi:hypothetical protein